MDFDSIDTYDDDFSDDNKPSKVQLAKLDILNEIKRVAKETEVNIKFNEIGDVDSNISILNNYVSILTKLSEINEDNLSDGELDAIIEEAKKSTVELNFSNINDVLKENEEEENQQEKGKNLGGNDASLEF